MDARDERRVASRLATCSILGTIRDRRTMLSNRSAIRGDSNRHAEAGCRGNSWQTRSSWHAPLVDKLPLRPRPRRSCAGPVRVSASCTASWQLLSLSCFLWPIGWSSPLLGYPSIFLPLAISCFLPSTFIGSRRSPFRATFHGRLTLVAFTASTNGQPFFRTLLSDAGRKIRRLPVGLLGWQLSDCRFCRYHLMTKSAITWLPTQQFLHSQGQHDETSIVRPTLRRTVASLSNEQAEKIWPRKPTTLLTQGSGAAIETTRFPARSHWLAAWRVGIPRRITRSARSL